MNTTEGKINSITHKIHLTFYKYIIYMLVALQGKNTQTYPIVELYTFFHEQAVCKRDTKCKEAYLTSVANITRCLPFPDRVRDNVSTIQRTKGLKKKKKKKKKKKRNREWVSGTVM